MVFGFRVLRYGTEFRLYGIGWYAIRDLGVEAKGETTVGRPKATRHIVTERSRVMITSLSMSYPRDWYDALDTP